MGRDGRAVIGERLPLELTLSGTEHTVTMRKRCWSVGVLELEFLYCVRCCIRMYRYTYDVGVLPYLRKALYTTCVFNVLKRLMYKTICMISLHDYISFLVRFSYLFSFFLLLSSLVHSVDQLIDIDIYVYS